MEVVAKLNYLRMAPRKVRLVAALVRGRTVAEAESQLQFLAKRAAGPMLKLLRSAVSNAKHNFGIQKENLKITKITVDEGPALKRIRPRAFGRAFQIKKKTSHVTLVLGEVLVRPKKRRIEKPKRTQPVIRQEAYVPEERRGPRFPGPRTAEKVGRAKKTANVIRKVFQRKAI